MTRAGHSKKERETGQARVWSLRIRNVGLVCMCVCYLLRPFDCSANFNLNFCEPTNYSVLLFFMNINVKVKVKLFSAVRTTFEQVRGERAHKNANHSLSFVLLLHCNSSKFQLRFQFFLTRERKREPGRRRRHACPCTNCTKFSSPIFVILFGCFSSTRVWHIFYFPISFCCA